MGVRQAIRLWWTGHPDAAAVPALRLPDPGH